MSKPFHHLFLHPDFRTMNRNATSTSANNKSANNKNANSKNAVPLNVSETVQDL
jgi:hypothetical protein